MNVKAEQPETKRAPKPLANAEEILRRLRERIEAAQQQVPLDERPHCADCYRRGWAAALRTIIGEDALT